MGIKGLSGYIKQTGNICESINIKNEIENWQKNRGVLDGTKPKILIDLKGIMDNVVQNDEYGMVLGGRHIVYNQKLRQFFLNICKTNANLVLFLAGNEVNDDLPLHIPNHEWMYMSRLQVLDKIENKCDLAKYLSKCDTNLSVKQMSSAFDYNIPKICAEFGKLRPTFVRHNQEIGQYAQKHANEVLAVITNDTDILAFEGEFQYWQANSINLKELTGTRFNRKALLQNLGVSIHQLQLIGALSGGSYLPLDQLQTLLTKFPANLPKLMGGRIAFLAWYVKRHPVIAKTTNNKVSFNLKPIADDVFGPNYTTLELNTIYNGLMIYDTDFASDDDGEYRDDCLFPFNHKDQFSFVNFCKQNSTFMYFLMTDKVYKIKDIEYIDYRNFRSKNFAKLIVPMLMKLCGILYSNISPRKLTRRICMKYAHDEPAKVVDANIIYPKERIPQLFGLVFKYYETSYESQRWSLLGWVLDLDEAFIQSVSTNASIDKYLPVILALKFLLQNEEITAHEANVIMFTEKETRINLYSFNKLDYADYYPDVRYVRMAHLYVYIYKWMNHCLDVCGLHNKTDMIRFNSPKFHLNMAKYDLSNTKTTQSVAIKAMIETIWCF